MLHKNRDWSDECAIQAMLLNWHVLKNFGFESPLWCENLDDERWMYYAKRVFGKPIETKRLLDLDLWCFPRIGLYDAFRFLLMAQVILLFTRIIPRKIGYEFANY